MKSIRIAAVYLTVFTLVILASGMLFSQFPKLPKIIPDKIPGLENIIKRESPITNKLSDAVMEVPFLDDFHPKGKVPFSALSQNEKGAFIIEEPGPYFYVVQSYCLHAGAYEPGKGDGYLYAPVKGPQADIFTHIVQRSYEHTEIPQHDIQVLLWAILARTKISDMADELQIAAAKLLTPKELFEINGGALELVPDDVLEKATIDMPAQARRIMEAEAGLRNKLSAGEQKYEELEGIAVRHGVAPIGEGSRDVPRGRWSYREEGYFVRYFPSGYSQTQIELYAPEPIVVEKDGKGRIIAIADEFGNRIETEYDESVEVITIAGEPSLKGYAFSSVRIERNDPEDPENKKIHLEWKNSGWTFCGVPNGKGTVGSSPARFPGLKERYEWTEKHKQELQYLDKQFSPNGDNGEVLDLGSYARALQRAVGEDLSLKEEWEQHRALNLVKRAWASAVSKREGGYTWSCAPSKELETYMFASLFPLLYLFTTGKEGAPEYDPSGDVAQPVNTSNQRLLQSVRPTGCWSAAENDLYNAVNKCFAEHTKAGKGTCKKRVVKCWWNRAMYYGGTKRHLCIGRDCKTEGTGENMGGGTEINDCINNAINDFMLHIRLCTIELEE